MPTCPHCKEFYFGNPDLCPSCYYEFRTGLLKKPEIISQIEIGKREERIRQEAAERERAQKEHDERALALLNSAQYEYCTEFLSDSYGGVPDKHTLDAVLTRYASNGWRLHSVLTNEAGKNAHSVSVGGTSFGTNSTMDVTILIFERCIKLAQHPYAVQPAAAPEPAPSAPTPAGSATGSQQESSASPYRRARSKTTE